MSATCAHCGTENPNWIPKKRLGEKQSALEAVEAKLEASKAEAARLKAEAASTATAHTDALAALQSQLDDATGKLKPVEELQTQLEELQGRNGALELRQSFMSAGLTDSEGLKVAETMWNALGDDRPDTVDAWLQDGAPAGVRMYLGNQGGTGDGKPPGAPEGNGGGNPPAPPAPPAPQRGGFTKMNGGGAPPDNAVTPEQIRSMSRDELDQYIASQR